MMTEPAFVQYIGIDYSGAKTPDSSLKGLRVYEASRESEPEEVEPPPSPRKYWTRRSLAEWLAKQLLENHATLVGIDHAFSFPLRYFEKYELERNWHTFLDDFKQYWTTDQKNSWVKSIKQGTGGSRLGDSTWKRKTEEGLKAKSVFHFDVPGQVAKSTHAGLPWLLYLQQQAKEKIHFWPFDGWDIPKGKSAVIEVYPALWNKNIDRKERAAEDQHDAFVVATSLKKADRNGELQKWLNPDLLAEHKKLALIEGWIIGVLKSSYGKS